MKTEWDYTELADAYIDRPDYADDAINEMLAAMKLKSGLVCDVGAGVAHLTLKLASRGFEVVAVEPNDAMRANGIKRTANYRNVTWHDGTGEQTMQRSQVFDLVTFGSSFNVCDRAAALIETSRILKPKGWFACMWNHRDLSDPIQSSIEEIIKARVPEYGYGTRREDQTTEINSSALFGPVIQLEALIMHEQCVADCINAWHSHATLARQAGSSFESVVDSIAKYLTSLNKPVITIPYTTRIWAARLI